MDLLGWMGGLQAVLEFFFRALITPFNQVMYTLIAAKKLYYHDELGIDEEHDHEPGHKCQHSIFN